MKKRVLRPKRINLDLLYPIVSVDPENDLNPQDYLEDDYDYGPEEEYKNPENKRDIPDGEQAFFSAIKNGEDW